MKKSEIIKRLSNIEKDDIGIFTVSQINELSKQHCKSSNCRNLFGLITVILFLINGSLFSTMREQEVSMLLFSALFVLLLLSTFITIFYNEKYEEVEISCELPSRNNNEYLIHPFLELEKKEQEIANLIIYKHKEQFGFINERLKKLNRKLIYAEYSFLIKYENIINERK